jgi:hypothetical protein
MNARLLILAIASFAFTLTSCTEVTFPEPQPKGIQALMQVPPSIRGHYIPVVPSDEKADTLIIDHWGYHFKDSNDKDWLGRGVLSDSLVIKFYKEYYFVNFRMENGRWVLKLLKPNPAGSLEYFTMDLSKEDQEAELVTRLSKVVPVKKVEDDNNTYYEIDPTRDQLMSLISAGYFTGTVFEKKVAGAR